MSKEDLIKKISKQLLNSSDRILKKDFSELAGSPEDVQFKIKIFNKIHKGINNVNELQDILKKDLRLLQPVLDEIEDLVGKHLSKDRTVVIKDGSFFDDKKEMDRFVKGIGKIE